MRELVTHSVPAICNQSSIEATINNAAILVILVINNAAILVILVINDAVILVILTINDAVILVFRINGDLLW